MTRTSRETSVLSARGGSVTCIRLKTAPPRDSIKYFQDTCVKNSFVET